MRGNSSGSYTTTVEAEMLVFDALPPELRRALRRAIFDWPPTMVARELLAGASAGGLVRAVAANDRLEIARRDALDRRREAAA